MLQQIERDFGVSVEKQTKDDGRTTTYTATPATEGSTPIDRIETDDDIVFYLDVPGQRCLRTMQVLHPDMPFAGPTLQLQVHSSAHCVKCHMQHADVACGCAGLDKKDLKIQVNQSERTLTVGGERVQPVSAEDDTTARNIKTFERRFGKFSRSLPLPETADPQLVSAKYVLCPNPLFVRWLCTACLLSPPCYAWRGTMAT